MFYNTKEKGKIRRRACRKGKIIWQYVREIRKMIRKESEADREEER